MKKIVVYGRGKTAEKFIELMNGDANYKVVGVTDTYAENNEENFCDMPVVHKSVIEKEEVDYVVICSYNCADEIEKELHLEYPKSKNICTMGEFFVTINEENLPNLTNNELYRFFMSESHRTMTKWLHYFEIYDKFFHKYKGKDIVFCEVGVFKGGSLQMWKKYFGDKATIIGIDVDEECKKFEEKKVHIEIGSQGDKKFWDYIKEKYPKIDILLDDGGHEMSLQKTTIDCMFSHIQNGGVYMCEDTHTSYWKEFGGEYKGDTFIEYAKGFVDEINSFHTRCEQMKVGYNTLNMAALHFYDSMVVIEKENRKVRPISILKEDENKAYVWPF